MSAIEAEEAVDPPEQLPRYQQFNPADPNAGYCRMSMIVHGVSIAVTLFLAMMLIFAGWYAAPPPLDLAVAAFLFYHVGRRVTRGFPPNTNTWLPLAVLFRFAQVTMLLALALFALSGLALHLLAGNMAPTVLGVTLFELSNAPFPWWQAFVQAIYRFAVIAFALGALVQLGAVLQYRREPGAPNIKRLISPVPGGR
ncbi:MAG: hypothetical protein AAF940_12270 [Pseudomonadota bacterium]